MVYDIEELEKRILYYFSLPNVTKATKYQIHNSVENQLGNYHIKMDDIVVTLSNLEDKNKVKNTYYEINKSTIQKISSLGGYDLKTCGGMKWA